MKATNLTVLNGYDNLATLITLNNGDGYMLQEKDSFDLIWWNSSDYSNPYDDPFLEIVKCIAKYNDTLIILRGQNETSASEKNIAGKIYKMIPISPDPISPDPISPDIGTLSFYNAPQIHGKTKHDSTTIDGGITLPIGQLPSHSSSQHTGTIGSTSMVSEGTNLYYTDARARAAISSSVPITYSPSTGAIGITQAGSGSSGYLSTTDWNTFNNKVNKTGDIVSGNLTINAQYVSTKFPSSTAVNWNYGNVQSISLGNGPNGITLSNGLSGGRYMLILTSGGASTTATWSGGSGVRWPGGIAPTLSTTAGKVDIVTFVFDGSYYYGNASYNY